MGSFTYTQVSGLQNPTKTTQPHLAPRQHIHKYSKLVLTIYYTTLPQFYYNSCSSIPVLYWRTIIFLFALGCSSFLHKPLSLPHQHSQLPLCSTSSATSCWVGWGEVLKGEGTRSPGAAHFAGILSFHKSQEIS